MNIADEILEEVNGTRKGYWTSHEYNRLRVDLFIERFCGWKPLTELLSYIPCSTSKETEKNFFVCLFLTGARALECLSLQRLNFTIEEQVIHAEFVLSKRYKKVGLKPDGKHWETKPVLNEFRKFDIVRREPFSPILEEYLARYSDPTSLLFASPFAHRPKYNKVHNLKKEANEKPYTRQWAYLLIRRVNDLLPNSLKNDLGLYQTWLDEDGKRVIWKDGQGREHNGSKQTAEVHLWLHYFRAQRASQLRHDYHLPLEDIKDYFRWRDYATAERYSKQGQKTITDKMLSQEIAYV
jgi:hypothetical protein